VLLSNPWAQAIVLLQLLGCWGDRLSYKISFFTVAVFNYQLGNA
jgi:hypothetical protein